MKYLTALAAPILLALVLTASWFPAPRSAPDSDSPGLGTAGEGRAPIGAPDPASRPVASHPADRGITVPRAGAPALVDEGASSIQVGVATYCKPNPPYCLEWGEPALLGAMPGFTYGDAPYTATVCRTVGTPCVEVLVVSYCACGDRPGGPTVIDLSPAAFRAINGGSLAAGVIDVTVSIGSIALPPTDTED